MLVISGLMSDFFLLVLLDSRGSHTPLSQGEIKDNPFSSSAEEPEELEWSQETDHNDFETLSYQSESHLHTKNDLSETASYTGSLLSDLTEAVCFPPRASPIDREASCG